MIDIMIINLNDYYYIYIYLFENSFKIVCTSEVGANIRELSVGSDISR